METYCVSCKKYTTNENSCVRKTKQNKLMLLSNCAVCVATKKKSIFIKNQELQNFKNVSNEFLKMSKIINKFLFTGDKSMPELH